MGFSAFTGWNKQLFEYACLPIHMVRFGAACIKGTQAPVHMLPASNYRTGSGVSGTAMHVKGVWLPRCRDQPLVMATVLPGVGLAPRAVAP